MSRGKGAFANRRGLSYQTLMSETDFAVTPAQAADIDPVEIAALHDSANRASELLKRLANKQRLVIMCKLMEGECSVSYLADHVGLAQSATSQHLAKLRESGLLSTRRDAQTVFYRIEDENAVKVLKTLCDIFAPPGHP